MLMSAGDGPAEQVLGNAWMVSLAQQPAASLMFKERQREFTALAGVAFLVARQSQKLLFVRAE